MRRKLTIAIIVVALVAGATGVGWLYFSLNPGAWQGFIAQMRGDTGGTSPARPVSRPARRSAGLVASGNIEAEEISIAAEMGGRIADMLVDEGDQVAAGEVLVQLDPTLLMVQREQAAAALARSQGALDAAQAQLDLTRSGARPEEIAAAEGAVDEAQSGLAAARGQLAAAEADLQIAQAQLAAAKADRQAAEAQLSAAQAGVEGADAQLSTAQARVQQSEAQLAQARDRDPTPDITAAQVALERATIALDNTQDEYKKALDRPWEDQAIRDEWAKRLKQAQLDYRLAEAQLDGARKAQQAYAQGLRALEAQVEEAEAQSTPAGVAGAEAQFAQAQAGVEAAGVQVAQAEGGVEAAQAAVDVAQAGVGAAQARLDQAQAALDLLRAGPRAQEVALLEANVAQADAVVRDAEAALHLVDAQIARLQLAAPVGGIVLDRMVHAGELAVPDVPLLTIANLDDVTLTVYVPEADLGQVSLGQQAEVTVDAYQDAFPGVVSHIASQAEFTPNNVQTQQERVHMVFAVKIKLPNADHRLKPGMPADAAFQ
ncbi:MAG: efflux RND transporter periplasmic adaptor subunit [Anaerolineae bacterium]